MILKVLLSLLGLVILVIAGRLYVKVLYEAMKHHLVSILWLDSTAVVMTLSHGVYWKLLIAEEKELVNSVLYFILVLSATRLLVSIYTRFIDRKTGFLENRKVAIIWYDERMKAYSVLVEPSVAGMNALHIIGQKHGLAFSMQNLRISGLTEDRAILLAKQLDQASRPNKKIIYKA